MSRIADIILEAGNARAAALRQGGAIIGNTIANVSAIPAQMSAQANDPQRQMAVAQVADLKRQQAGRQTLAQMIKANTPDDGSAPDHEKIAAGVSAAGYPDVAEAWLKTAAANSENLEKLRTAKRAYETAATSTIGDLAFSADSPAAFTAAVGLAAQHHLIDEQTAHGVLDHLDQQGPEAWQAARAQYLPFSPKWQKQQEEFNKLVVVPEGGSVVSGGKLVFQSTKPPKTEAELAADAANPESPTAAVSKAGLDLLTQAKQTPGNGELKSGRLDGKVVFATFDPKTRRLMYQGKDVTDALQPLTDPLEVQATALAAQVAQQARAQAFTEQEAGRKELSEKVEQPYKDAREKADLMRGVIAAAQNGNMSAANVQGLLGVLGLVTTEGVKRINTTELEQVQGAGSLLDRIKGKVGKLVAGQPLDAKVQSDLRELSNLLEQSAYKKYAEGHKTTTKRYGLKDEQPLPAPAGVAPPPALPPGLQRLQDR